MANSERVIARDVWQRARAEPVVNFDCIFQILLFLWLLTYNTNSNYFLIFYSELALQNGWLRDLDSNGSENRRRKFVHPATSSHLFL